MVIKRNLKDDSVSTTEGSTIITDSTTESITNNTLSSQLPSFSTTENDSTTLLSTSNVPPIPNANTSSSMSAVWSYFDKDALGNSICKFCERSIKGHHSSNLLSHLRTAGRTDPAHQHANAICEEHRESKRYAKRQKTVADHLSMTNTNLSTEYLNMNAALMQMNMLQQFNKRPEIFTPQTNVAAAAVAAALSKEQRDILGMYAPQFLVMNQDQCTQEIAFLALMDTLPVSFATTRGFQRFMLQLSGGEKKTNAVRLPNEEELLKHIDIIEESALLTMKMLLSNVHGVGIGVESWKSEETAQEYLLTHAFYSVNYRKYHVLIGMNAIDSIMNIDQESLKNMVNEHVERVGATGKVLTWHSMDWRSIFIQSSDSISSLSFPGFEFPWTFALPNVDGHLSETSMDLTQPPAAVQCSVKLLHDCLSKETFSSYFPEAVSAIDEFLLRFTKHPEAMQHFQARLQSVGRTNVSFMTPSASEISYYHILSDLHDVLPLMAEQLEVSFLPVKSLEWITFMTTKLKPFAKYATAFAGDGEDEKHKDTLSSVSTIMTALNTFVTAQLNVDDKVIPESTVTPIAWSAFLQTISKKLSTLLEQLPKVALAATLLDPRYKTTRECYFNGETDVLRANGYLQQLVCANGNHLANSTPQQNAPASNDIQTTEPDNSDDLLGHLASSISDVHTMSAEAITATVNNVTHAGQSTNDLMESTLEKELTAFLSLPIANRNIDPLQWWKANQLRFPLLAPYSEMLLSLPAACVSRQEVCNAMNLVCIRAVDWTESQRLKQPIYMSFQTNKEYILEWFSTPGSISSHGVGDTGSSTDVMDTTSDNNFTNSHSI